MSTVTVLVVLYRCRFSDTEQAQTIVSSFHFSSLTLSQAAVRTANYREHVGWRHCGPLRVRVKLLSSQSRTVSSSST